MDNSDRLLEEMAQEAIREEGVSEYLDALLENDAEFVEIAVNLDQEIYGDPVVVDWMTRDLPRHFCLSRVLAACRSAEQLAVQICAGVAVVSLNMQGIDSQLPSNLTSPEAVRMFVEEHYHYLVIIPKDGLSISWEGWLSSSRIYAVPSIVELPVLGDDSKSYLSLMYEHLLRAMILQALGLQSVSSTQV